MSVQTAFARPLEEKSAQHSEAAATTASDRLFPLRRLLEALLVPLVALLAAAAAFSLFLLFLGKSPLEFFALVWRGAFGGWFSLQNSLQRAAPLLLTALCVALPAHLGLVVIGGEGALVLGGLAAAVIGALLAGWPALIVQLGMGVAAVIVGGAWIGLAGWLRAVRGINETISSLLLTYIAIALMNHFVEGPLRDPASLNKPSTMSIGDANMVGHLPGMDVHWGLVYGIVFCIVAYVLVRHTVHGFALRIVGGNVRAAKLAGLPVGILILVSCFLGGAAAGLAGMAEVAAVHGSANGSLIAGYGYAGIMVSFIARHNPLAILPVATLLGGIAASGGMLQRRLDLPDATVLVLEGIAFMVILASETLYGRFRIFQSRET
jgi:ABC-type uncharacterized transport system permease subunit